MKIDPYKKKECYIRWKNEHREKELGIGKENTDLLMSFLNDMEIGLNVASGSRKGSRSFVRLIALRDRTAFVIRKCRELYGINLIGEIKEEQLHSLFTDMRNGKILKTNGLKYKSISDFIKVFKTFWHWYQKISKKKGVIIDDITKDLDASEEKPDWVYLTEDEVKKLCDNAKPYYKVLMTFLFDTGIRAPTELMNIQVSDFFNDFKELNIREEISKTFGRRIKLMLCSEMIKDYVKANNLQFNDYLFTKSPSIANQYLKRLAISVLGDKQSPAGQRYSELSMYDFRHISCCYWLPRYKSESALKYRFGWKSSDKIHYYSELLGMKDTINENDMLIDITKTEIEKKLEKSEKEKLIMQDRINNIEMDLANMKELVKYLKSLINNTLLTQTEGVLKTR